MKYAVSGKPYRPDKGQGHYAYNLRQYPKLVDIIETHYWSPIRFKGGRRKAENFISAAWLVLDFDGTRKMGDVCKEFSNYKYICAPTRRHEEGEHRFRFALPLAEPIEDLGDYQYNLRLLIKAHKADPQASGGAQIFAPSRYITDINDEGELYEWQPEPMWSLPVPEPRCTEPTTTPRVKKLLAQTALGGREHTCYLLGRALYVAGFAKAEAIAFVEANYKPEDPSSDPFRWGEIPRQVGNGWDAEMRGR